MQTESTPAWVQRTHRGSTAQLPAMRRWAPRGREPRAYVYIDGKRLYLGPWGSADAAQRYAQVLTRLTAGSSEPAIARPGTVAELAARFLADAATYYTKNGRPTRSLANARIVVRLIEAAGLHQTRLTDLGPLWLKHFQRWLAQHPDGRWSRATVNEYVAIAVRMCSFGVAEQLVEGDLVGRLRTVRPLRRGRGVGGAPAPLREHQAVESVDRSILRRSCRFLPLELRVMVNLQLLTGMRPTEVCAMRPAFLHPCGVAGVVVYRVPADANKLDHLNIAREVYLGPRAQRLLAMVTPADPTAHFFSPARVMLRLNRERSAARKTKRWPSHAAAERNRREHDGRQPAIGDRYTPDSYRRAIARACGRAFGTDERGNPIVWWAPNQLRHTGATAIANRADLHLASRALGHRDIATTLRYVHATDRQLAAIAARTA